MNEKKNVFNIFNRFPFEHECRHAVKLVKLCMVHKTDNEYEACYDHISPPPSDLDCRQLGNRIQSLWSQELKQKGRTKANLALVLFKCLCWDYLAALAWSILIRVLLVFALLGSLRQILICIDRIEQVKRLEDPDDELASNQTIARADALHLIGINEDSPLGDSDLDAIYSQIMILAAGLLLSVGGYFIFTSKLKLMYSRCGLKCRTCLLQLIQRKSLRLHMATSIEQSSARTLSLVSNEVSFVEEANKYLVYLVTGPVCLLSSFLWLHLSQPYWEPLALIAPPIAALMLLQLYLPRFYERTSRRRIEITNERIDVMSTFLNSIKIVKMYAWEPSFQKKVQQLRELEMKQIKKLNVFALFDYIIVDSSWKVLPAIIYLSYILIHNRIDRHLLFTTPAAFTFFRIDAFLFFPKALKSFSDLTTACKNIQNYLLSEETNDDRLSGIREKNVSLICRNVGICPSNKFAAADPDSEAKKNPTLSKLAQFHHNKLAHIVVGEPILVGLDMKLETGDLAIVCGKVGSGKSSLLLSLLGEIRITCGLVQVSDGARFAYASQEPCLFADTLKNNILNGRPLDADRYRQVIDVCSLKYDINLLPDGDETQVGSKGVSLSGGQKARISLARAIYSKADIYLLDDPLAAVDSKVARHIFTRCIKEFLSGKLVVLATHQVQFLSEADTVVLLRRGAKPIVGSTGEMLEREEIQQLLSQLKKVPEKGADSGDPIIKEDSTKAIDIPKTVDQPRKIEETNCRLNAASKFIPENGTKKGSAYLFVLKYGLPKWRLPLFVVVTLVSCFFMAYSDYYFKIWSENALKIELSQASGQEHLKLLINDWLVYVIVLVCYCSAIGLNNVQVAGALRNSANHLHYLLIESLFKAKMSFYDFCQTGDLSSRYAGDFAIIDHGTNFNSLVVTACVKLFVASSVCITIMNPLQVIPFLLMPFICSPVAVFNYWKLRVLMRLSKALRSPVYSNLAVPIDDLATVRSDPDHLRAAKMRFDESQNKLATMSLLALVYETQLAYKLRSLSMFLVGVMFYIVFGLFKDELTLSATGTFLLLIIGASNSFPAILEYGSSLDTNMISVDNVRKYTNLEPEEDNKEERSLSAGGLEIASSKQPTQMADSGGSSWLRAGRIEFRKVSMRYFSDERPALENLSFLVEAGERIGVVGRTGAGKSSIISLMYRLYPFEGTILIDDSNTKNLKLADLRSSLGVIPQDPVLFNDTLRKNLDPFERYSDEQIWSALEVVNLRAFVALNLQPTKLDYPISGGGRNFSVGQRQLVCLARAILRTPKVVLIDEATANVDAETDALIQRTIRSQFISSTIITIAHRLNTVLDYDRVMVLEAGKIVEFDRADRLLKLEGGVFRSMVERSRPE